MDGLVREQIKEAKKGQAKVGKRATSQSSNN
jgi:hypothetical protein